MIITGRIPMYTVQYSTVQLGFSHAALAIGKPESLNPQRAGFLVLASIYLAARHLDELAGRDETGTYCSPGPGCLGVGSGSTWIRNRKSEIRLRVGLSIKWHCISCTHALRDSMRLGSHIQIPRNVYTTTFRPLYNLAAPPSFKPVAITLTYPNRLYNSTLASTHTPPAGIGPDVYIRSTEKGQPPCRSIKN
ncbi:hypothetical protein BJV78DRAFT_388474 [Lactifluus subvellereus]|nr:hypothetical protein BJV78DRAFT_388474 [Lactifluus subvellereus]